VHGLLSTHAVLSRTGKVKELQNSIFGKIGRIASEDVSIELLKTKCMPVLLYGFEVCNLCKRDLIFRSDFVVN